MKTIHPTFFCLASLLSINALAGHTASKPAQASAETVLVESKNVHVPAGYDYNDLDIVVFTSGELPDTCHRRPEGIVSINADGKIKIDVKATKINDPKLSCIMVTVPYMIPVSLGQLPEGTHNIVINAETPLEKKRTLFVDRPSSASVDNFSYANVTKIERVEGTKTIILEGYHPSSCISLTAIEVLPNSNLDTYSILPIIEQSQDECIRMIVPFSVELSLDGLDEGDVLVHVRKMDSHALNSFFPKDRYSQPLKVADFAN